MLREFFLGFVKIHVIHHAAEAPVYGLSLIEELGRHGYALGPGTLYPILRGLTEAGYLRREERVVGGKVRKYYSITRAGRAALAESRRQIAELVEEVLAPHLAAAPRQRRTSLPAPGRSRGRPPSRRPGTAAKARSAGRTRR